MKSKTRGRRNFGLAWVSAVLMAAALATGFLACSSEAGNDNPTKQPQPEETTPSEAQKEADGVYTVGDATYTVENGTVTVTSDDGTKTEVGKVSEEGVITITQGEKTTTITTVKGEDGAAPTTTVQVTTKTAEGTEESKTYIGDISTGTLTNKDDPADTVTVAKKIIVTYTVTFVTNCDTEIAPQTVKEGEKAVQPTQTLSKAGYEFGGWNLGENPFSIVFRIRWRMGILWS